jgi:DNA helicase II / ATP-dependent DNA helicase PcrA
MKYFADLHIHSRFSRATSRGLTLRTLAAGAAKKGVAVLGTGDFTHPAWLSEIEAELAAAEPGLLSLKDGSSDTRFMLTAEISTIYKQGEKVRKVHHLITAPDLEKARRVAASLARVGNILSDGRPILGITSRNLLEIVLEAGEHTMLIPAHIWTPWFSAMGSKSGFDSIAECYGDLAGHVFAVETGLSSDPAMNWMVRSLDAYRLVSNSDAHSVDKLGREATVFDCALDYFAMEKALKDGEGLAGTVEFFPEEGKYHLDGHRDCKVVLTPEETASCGGLCPVCGKKVTVGVLSRIDELADRHDGSMPESGRPFSSLIPLMEIVAEIMQVGSATGKVRQAYEGLTGRLGGELPLLLEAGVDEIRDAAGDILAQAISRMRAGEVHKQAGYDGEYGRIRVFRGNERDMLFTGELLGKPLGRTLGRPRKKARETGPAPGAQPVPARSWLTPGQEEAVAVREGFLIVKAGPGTGKTRTLVERARAILESGEESVLAITFTTRAAAEIRDRLGSSRAEVFTFHGLASRIMRECGIEFSIADEGMLEDILASWGEEDPQGRVQDMMLALGTGRPLESQLEHLLETLRTEGYYTYEGMIVAASELVGARSFRPAWDHVMADEFQDINPVQYRFLKELGASARSLMVIGDPNQAVYGFRGSCKACFGDFLRDFPEARTVSLTLSHRLSRAVAAASNAFIGVSAVSGSKGGPPVLVAVSHTCPELIASEIELLAGGLSHRGAAMAKAEYALSDIAVIVRTAHQARPVMEALARASIPFDTAYARPLASMPGVSQRVALLEGKDWQALVRGVGEQSMRRINASVLTDPAVIQKLEAADRVVTGLEGSVGERVSALEESRMFKLPALPGDHFLYQYARVFGSDVDGFVRFMRLSHDQGALQGEKVRVLTAHAAKGLEFRCVFVAGLSLGSFPLAGQDPAEEENLFYVAMTRASERLCLVSPQGSVSPFTLRIPEELTAAHQETRTAKKEQLLLFDQ